MRPKTSLFNPTLAKNSLRRFWPLPLGVLAYYLLIFVWPLYNYLSAAADPSRNIPPYTESLSNASNYYVRANLWYLLLSLGGICLIGAILLFRHLHTRRDIQFYLGLPLKRRCLYITSAAMGYFMVLLPMLLSEGIGLAVTLAIGSAAAPVLKLMAASFAVCTLFYGMAVLACILAGQSFGAILVYVGMNCAPLVISAGLGAVASSFLLGFSGTLLLPRVARWLTPVWVLYQESLNYYVETRVSLLASPATLVVYGIVGAALLLLSGVLYAHRRGEAAGDMLAFRAVKLLCKILGTLSVSMGLTFIFLDSMPMGFAIQLVLMLFFTAIGWIAAEMVIQKSFRVFQKTPMLQGGCMLLVILALMVAGKADLFGYVNRIPDPETVETAYVELNGLFSPTSGEKAAAVHQIFLDNRQELHLASNSYDSYWKQVSIRYLLKNGRSMERVYYMEVDDPENSPIANALNNFFMEPENNWETWFINWDGNLTAANFENAVVSGGTSEAPAFTATESFTPGTAVDFYAGQYEYSLTQEDALTLYGAILKDMADGSLRPQNYIDPPDTVGSDGHLGYVHFTRYERSYDSSKETYSHYAQTVSSDSAVIEIRESMTHTLEALEKIGLTLSAP